MKKENVTVLQIQEEFNAAMVQYSGARYEDAAYIQWIATEVNRILEKYRIKEMRPSSNCIRVDINEGGVWCLNDNAFRLFISAKHDKRCTFKNRGKVVLIMANFREDLLPLTLAQARRVLLEEARLKNLARLEVELKEAREKLAQLEKIVGDMKELKF